MKVGREKSQIQIQLLFLLIFVEIVIVSYLVINSNTTIVSINLFISWLVKRKEAHSNTTIVSINLAEQIEIGSDNVIFKYNYCFY